MLKDHVIVIKQLYFSGGKCYDRIDFTTSLTVTQRNLHSQLSYIIKIKWFCLVLSKRDLNRTLQDYPDAEQTLLRKAKYTYFFFISLL